MADKFTAKIKGLRTSQKKLLGLAASVTAETKDEMDIIVKDIEREGKRVVPRKSANLQRTINSEVEVSVFKGVIGLVGANTVYAEPLENPKNKTKHRTRKGFVGKPTPYLLPSLKKNFRKIVSGISRGVKKGVKKAR